MRGTVLVEAVDVSRSRRDSSDAVSDSDDLSSPLLTWTRSLLDALQDT